MLPSVVLGGGMVSQNGSRADSSNTQQQAGGVGIKVKFAGSFQHSFTQRGCAAPGRVPGQGNIPEHLSKLKMTSARRKIIVTCKSSVGDISAVTLIRTGITLDHSQKAEKVCSYM